MEYSKITAGLLGLAVGDALGVPFEFKAQSEMIKNPATDMVGYGTYSQPPGTWSDDSSLAFCLAESLLSGYDLKDIATKFVDWRWKKHWTARGELFYIGNTTAIAINRLKTILNTESYRELTLQKYMGNEYDNGNGSLMRILPLLFYIKGKPIKEQFDIIWDVSALTHRHIRAAMCCLIYLKLAEYLLNGKDKIIAYQNTQKDILQFWQDMDFSQNESKLFIRIIENDVREMPYEDLRSGGYVMESIHSSIWCFLQKDTYKETVLTAVNLGHDTDTTAAIAGGLAGIYYGAESIPSYWLSSIARMEDIIELGNQLSEKTFD